MSWLQFRHTVTPSTPYRLRCALLAVLTTATIFGSSAIDDASAQNRQKPLLFFKSESVDSGSNSADYARGSASSRGTLSLDLAQGFGTLLQPGPERSALFNAYYTDSIKNLQFQAQPTTNEADIDPSRSADLAQRVMTMQIGDAITSTLQHSELRQTYRQIVDGFQKLRRQLQFSVQQSEQGYSVSRAQPPPGRKIIQLDIQPNQRTGVSPQINIMEVGRLRYDRDNHAVMFEFRSDW